MNPDHTAAPRPDRHYRLLIGTAAFVIIAAGIRESAEVLNSILLAMLLTVTVVPAFDALRRRGVPKGLAVVLTSLLLAGLLVLLLATLGLSGTRLIRVLPDYQERAQSLRHDLERLLLARGIQPERILRLEVVDPNRLLGLAAGFLSGLGPGAEPGPAPHPDRGQSGLDVPPLVGLLSLVIWAYLLGPIGTILALPLTIALRRVLQDAGLRVPGLAARGEEVPARG